MWKSIFVIANRNFKAKLLYNLIVVGGMSIGMMVLLMVFQWTFWNFSFDRFFNNYKDIYRLTLEYQDQNTFMHTARLFSGQVPLELRKTNNFPEIESLVRLAPYRQAVIRVNEQSFYESDAYACDKEFFQLLSLKILQGNPEYLLDDPHSIILSESTARKYFGDENPVGQQIKMVNQYLVEFETYTVSGIFADIPENSHLLINAITPLSDPDNYTSTSFVYVRINPSANIQDLSRKIEKFIENELGTSFGPKTLVHFQNISDIHLYSHKSREMKRNGNILTILFLITGGIMVYMLAWFNFLLLSYSQKHMSIKRHIIQWQNGAGKRELYLQNLADNLLLGLIAFSISILLYFLLRSSISSYLNFNLFLNPLANSLGIILLLLLMILSTLVTASVSTRGLYGTIKDRFISNKPSNAVESIGQRWFIRLVIATEFIITFVLLVNLSMIRKQTVHSIGLQMGSNDTTTIQLPRLPRYVVNDYYTFKEALLKYPQIKDITASPEEPSAMTQSYYRFKLDGKVVENMSIFYVPVDTNFLNFYDIPILSGSNFHSDYSPADSTDTFILNETAARMLNYENPEDCIGRSFEVIRNSVGFYFPGKIVGISKDFRFDGPGNIQQPMVIVPKHWWLYCFSIRYNGNSRDAIHIIEKTWKELFPEYPLRYYYTTELYEQLYSNELFTIKLLAIFSIVSLIIAGTGLFALSGYFSDRKMYAAALRKIHGASTRDILFPELKFYLILSTLATIISIPLSLLLIKEWMLNFSDRITVPWWIFPLCFVLLTFFSWLAVFYHSLRLSRSNPLSILRR